MSSAIYLEVFEIPDDDDSNFLRKMWIFHTQYEEVIKEAVDCCPVDINKYEEQE